MSKMAIFFNLKKNAGIFPDTSQRPAPKIAILATKYNVNPCGYTFIPRAHVFYKKSRKS
jgi:hypothetical protein